MLKVSLRNTKIKGCGDHYGLKMATFGLPAGISCPMAKDCKSIFNRQTRKIEKYGKFTCYGASNEARFPSVARVVDDNLECTKSATFDEDMVELLSGLGLGAFRIHWDGDFYSFNYFKAWVRIARSMPDVMFWGYTKQATFVKWLQDNPIDNMKFVYSWGGRLDDYALKHNLPICRVRMPGEELDLPVACTKDNPYSDYEYIIAGISFCLDLH